MLVEFVITIFLIFIGLKIVSKLTIGRCTSSVCLIGKTALITGGNSAKQFDLASLTSVRNLAQDIIKNEKRLDILINNSAAFGSDSKFTEDGLQFGMQVNHFGSFLLTHLLIDLLKNLHRAELFLSAPATAFIANFKPKAINSPAAPTALYTAKLMDYSNAKLCNIISAREFSQKLKGTGVTSNSLHPGLVHTPITITDMRDDSSKYSLQCAAWNLIVKTILWFSKNPSEGAHTTVHLAVAKEVENITGRYFVDCKTFATPGLARNNNFSNQIWKLSEAFVKLTDDEML